MADNYIQLGNDDDLLIMKIKDSNGNETGEELVFDLNDVEFLLRYQNMLYKISKLKEKVKNDILVINKREDVKGKKLFSKNQEDVIKAEEDFIKNMAEAYNMFLGENGVQKLLNGRKLGWTSLATIDEIIEKQIVPKVGVTIEDVKKNIISKYGFKNEEEL